MRKAILQPWRAIETLLPFFVLTLLLAFTFAFFFLTPYYGFYFNPFNGEVINIYAQSGSSGTLEAGDILEQVGPTSFRDFLANPTLVLFDDIRAGQTIEIKVQRNGAPLTIQWVFPGFNQEELIGRILNLWWLAYFFWFFGMIIQLFMRPKDARWHLLVSANYITGLWLLFGTMSSWQIWRTSLLFHAVTWLALPVYLNLHWEFPKPLGRVPFFVWGVIYFAGGVFSVAQFLQIFPRSFYYIGVIIMLAGSIMLLVLHFARQPEQRREVGLLSIAALLALAPSASLGIIGIFGNFPAIGPLALCTLPLLPAAYFYVVYRRRSGGLELRANRVMTMLVYGALLLTVSIPATFLIESLSTERGATITLELAYALLISLGTAVVFPHFQRWVEHRVLGIPLPPARVLELYAGRIITSMENERLRSVIRDEVLPSLLIRQAALLQLDDAHVPIPICTLGVSVEQLPGPGEIPALLAEGGKIRLPASGKEEDHPCPWVRLVLPLVLENKPIGLCLLGRRDPDDYYSAVEIPTLQALMDQTALALMNIQQAERLGALYKADIERYEAERNHLALELHDDVLGQMALLAMNVGDNASSPQFDQAYHAATDRIRQIVNGLRPTMLNYGLQPALDELADDLRALDVGIVIGLEVPPTDVRYSPTMELHLFRIVQEACQNALQHAQARTIHITGNLEPGHIELIVEDDGIGFSSDEQLDLPGLLVNRHFGLAGMYERAALVGAKMVVETAPERGTRVRVTWDGKEFLSGPGY